MVAGDAVPGRPVPWGAASRLHRLLPDAGAGHRRQAARVPGGQPPLLHRGGVGRDVAHPAEDDWELQSLAQVQIAGRRAYGKPDLASFHSALDEKLRLAEEADRADQVIKLLVLQALAWQAEGQIAQAMMRLEQALALATPLGYTLTFVQHGAPMEVLLREAAACGIAVAYVDRLLSALAGEAIASPTRPLAHHPPQPLLLEPLSERELEVLRLLSSSLTGPQIADQLSISVGTFRSHTKSIYGKLGAHSRIEAIERARDLDLV